MCIAIAGTFLGIEEASVCLDKESGPGELKRAPNIGQAWYMLHTYK